MNAQNIDIMKFRKFKEYFLLCLIISFLGYVYETILSSIQQHKFCDRGFLILPFCFIYGLSILFIYFLIGVPKNLKFIKFKINTNIVLKYFIYFLLFTAICTLGELIVGFVAEKVFLTKLWDYSNMLLNFNGYIALLPSLFWGVGGTLFMGLLFEPIKNSIHKMSTNTLDAVFLIFTILILLDYIFNVIYIINFKKHFDYIKFFINKLNL